MESAFDDIGNGYEIYFHRRKTFDVKATVNEIHVSGQGITLQLMRAGGIHYSL